MNDRREQIQRALQQMIERRRAFDFQALAVHLQKSHFPALQAAEWNHDGGEDAFPLPVEGPDGKKCSLACSLTATLTKVRQDCQRIQERGVHPDIVIFVTAGYVERTTIDRWKEKIRKEFSHELEVMSRNAIITELERPVNNWLCRDYLDLPSAEPSDADLLTSKVQSNFPAFCAAQSEANLSPLVGSKQDRSKKYLPELHTPRLSLLQMIDAFLQSEKPKPFFAVLGASGRGKTSSLCHLTRFLLARGELVLFFRGNSLREDLLKELGQEFNMHFPGFVSSEIEVLKKVEAVLNGRRLIVIVDAIDEWTHPQKVQSLERLAFHLVNSPVRLIVSCKLNSWREFVEQRGTPTGINALVYHDEEQAPSPPAHVDSLPGYYLPSWDDQEFHETLERYRKFYSFHGSFEDKVFQEARQNPFFLRVLFEVVESAKLEHMVLSTEQFFEEYYQKLTAKTGQQELAQKQLKRVAKALFDKNVDSLDKGDVERIVGLGANTSLLHELFKYNILELIPMSGSEHVRFAFQELRDYLIVFHVQKWHAMPLGEFSQSVANLQKMGYIRRLFNSSTGKGARIRTRCLIKSFVLLPSSISMPISLLSQSTSRPCGVVSPLIRMVRSASYQL